MNFQFTNKQRLIIVSVFGVIVLGSLIYFSIQGFNKNPNGEFVQIQGYDKKVKNLPKEYKDSLTAMLYKTIKLNSKDGVTTATVTSISDAVIREGSEIQDEITKRTQFSGSFTVDIESIRQSYSVQYTYSTDPNDSFNSGYPLLISCLPKDQLIYGDFNCKNTFDQTNTTDPLIGALPYETDDYKISAVIGDGGVVTLDALLYISDSDRRINLDKAVTDSKERVLNWVRGRGVDPNNYIINYTY